MRVQAALSRLARILPLFVAVLALMPSSAYGALPLNQRVLVVYNSDVRDSHAVANYYISKRQIPERNLCRISVSSTDAIDQRDFESDVKKPVRKCLDTVGRQNILYIVFSYQTPYDITIQGHTYALDQFVSDIWDDFIPFRPAAQSDIHPYFGKAESEGYFYEPFVPLADYRDAPGAKLIYSVWRLDGANANLARGLVDKAVAAEANGLSGKACFDRRYGAITRVGDFNYGAGDWDIYRAAEFARNAGFPVVDDENEQEFGTAPAPLRCDGAALYAGWYSLNHYNNAFTWNPGAIGIHLDSASAVNPRGGPNWAANATTNGITVTSGAVTEPFLENLPHPDQVIRYLLQGANAGDAFLRSTRLLKWMIINIGDPLYRPFAKPRLMAGPAPELVLALLPQASLGGAASAGAIAFEHALTKADMRFAVKTDRPDIVSVPDTVTLTAGTPNVRFPIETRAVPGDSTLARIYASSGEFTRSNTLALFPLLAPLALEPATVKAGTAAMGIVTLRQSAPSGGLKVALATDHPGVAHVPPELTVPEGQSSATFPIGTVPSGAGPVLITASFGGVTRTATLTIAQ